MVWNSFLPIHLGSQDQEIGGAGRGQGQRMTGVKPPRPEGRGLRGASRSEQEVAIKN